MVPVPPPLYIYVDAITDIHTSVRSNEIAQNPLSELIIMNEKELVKFSHTRTHTKATLT